MNWLILSVVIATTLLHIRAHPVNLTSLRKLCQIESQLSDRVSRLFSATWDSPRGFHGPTRSLRLSEALASARHRDGFPQHEKGSQTPKPSSTEKNRE